VDNNIFASKYSLENHSQGGAYINNIVCGRMKHRKILDRATQYNLPHSTEVKGFALIYGGDDRFFNNIFIGEEGGECGTAIYNGYTASLEEYIEKVNEINGDHERFDAVGQPVYINNNAYFNGAEPFEREKENLVETNFIPNLEIIDKGDEVYLSCEMPESFENIKTRIQSTDTLTRVRIADAEFENPDGSKLILDTDLLDGKRDEKSPLGPIVSLKKGKNHIRIW